MNDFLSQWLEDNYVYVAMALSKTETDRNNMLTLNRICKEHNITLKQWLDVLSKYTAEVSND